MAELQKQGESQENRTDAELAVLNDSAADIHAELTALNMNISLMLASLQNIEKKQQKMTKDIKSITAMLLFWLIISLIAGFFLITGSGR